MSEIRNPKNPYHYTADHADRRAAEGLADAWEAGYSTGQPDGVRSAHASRVSQIRDLELAEALAQNAKLGAQMYQLEIETISLRAKAVQLETQLALEQRRPLGAKIQDVVAATEYNLQEAKRAVSQNLGVQLNKDLTAARLKSNEAR